jgi:hypothetical protein
VADHINPSLMQFGPDRRFDFDYAHAPAGSFTVGSRGQPNPRADLNNFLGPSSSGYGSGLPQELQDLIMSRARGTVQPFTQPVIQGMFSQNADSAAGQYGSARDQILQQFSRSGLGGSGMELSAMLQAQSQAAGNARAGRRDISTRAAIENYGALERAQDQAARYLQEKANYEQRGQQFQASQAQQLSEFNRQQDFAEKPKISTLAGGGGNVFNQQRADRGLQDWFQQLMQTMLGQQQDQQGQQQGQQRPPAYADPGPAQPKSPGAQQGTGTLGFPSFPGQVAGSNMATAFRGIF